MMYWYDHGFGGWSYAGMVVGMVVFWAILLGGIFVLLRYTSSRDNTGSTAPRDPDPQQLLAARYARGEIDDTEYRQRLTVLREHTSV